MPNFEPAERSGAQAFAEKLRNGCRRLKLEELRPVYTDAGGPSEVPSAGFHVTDSKGRTFKVRVTRYR